MQRPVSSRGSGGGAGGGGGAGRRRRGERDSPPAPPNPLPVFLFPSELLFYADQRSSHRRVLTLYNPYTFPLSFKVLCTAPRLYSVVEAEGSVRAKSCVDLVVRHQEVTRVHWGRRDRFRLEVQGGGGQTGSREVWAELRAEGEESPQRRAVMSPQPLPRPRPQPYLSAYPVRSPSQLAVCVVVGVACVALLMLPLHSQLSSLVPTSLVPSYAHVSLGQKLVCAYILGLLTMVFLR